LKNKNVLVTGGAGVIGSHVVDQLVLNHGAHVVVLDDFSDGKLAYIEKSKDQIEVIRRSITDKEAVKIAMENVDYVIHEAAYADVAGCVYNPDIDFKVNVEGTYNVLKAALDSNIERFIFISSAAVYGDSAKGDRCFTEEEPVDPISTYGASKLYGEQITKVFCQLYGLKVTVLRYFSIYGPRQIPKKGSHSWAVAIFVIRAMKGKPIYVFGGDQIRDQTYNEDAAKATILALAEPKAVGEIINVGTGRPTSILELAKIVTKLIKDVPIEFKERPKGDPMGGYADLSKLKRTLGYAPDVPLEEGIKKYYEWLKMNRELIPDWI